MARTRTVREKDLIDKILDVVEVKGLSREEVLGSWRIVETADRSAPGQDSGGRIGGTSRLREKLQCGG
ncbi:hypothetical protein FACS1894190_17780 [Spirochaetia bacterium]|nr:hypothetical protein FACS1894190_17780 [Spirochaetia bacterium]